MFQSGARVSSNAPPGRLLPSPQDLVLIDRRVVAGRAGYPPSSSRAAVRVARNPAGWCADNPAADICSHGFTRSNVIEALRSDGWQTVRLGYKPGRRARILRRALSVATRGRSDEYLAYQWFALARPLMAPVAKGPLVPSIEGPERTGS